MFRFDLILITLAVFVSVISADDFPTDLEPCTKSNTECLKKGLQKIVSKGSKGHRPIKLIQFEPLSIKSLDLPKVPGSPVGIELKFKDVELTGISSANIIKMSPVKEESPKKFTTEIDVKFPKITLAGPYVINGQVLILPITGKGDCKIIFDDVTGKIKAKGSLVEKKGKSYLNIDKVHLDLQPKKTIFSFANLFNGDKALGDNMNVFLNENWSEVYTELKPVIMEAIGKILLLVANGVFSTVEYADIFLPDNS